MRKRGWSAEVVVDYQTGAATIEGMNVNELAIKNAIKKAGWLGGGFIWNNSVDTHERMCNSAANVLIV